MLRAPATQRETDRTIQPTRQGIASPPVAVNLPIPDTEKMNCRNGNCRNGVRHAPRCDAIHRSSDGARQGTAQVCPAGVRGLPTVAAAGTRLPADTVGALPRRTRGCTPPAAGVAVCVRAARRSAWHESAALLVDLKTPYFGSLGQNGYPPADPGAAAPSRASDRPRGGLIAAQGSKAGKQSARPRPDRGLGL